MKTKIVYFFCTSHISVFNFIDTAVGNSTLSWVSVVDWGRFWTVNSTFSGWITFLDCDGRQIDFTVG